MTNPSDGSLIQNTKSIISYLDAKSKIKIFLIFCSTSALSVVDIIGTIFVALAISGIQNQGAGDRPNYDFGLLPLKDYSRFIEELSTNQLFFIGLMFMLLKSLVSILLAFFSFHNLITITRRVSQYFFRQYLRMNLTFFRNYSSQRLFSTFGEGINSLFIIGVSSIIVIFTEIILILVYLGYLFFVSKTVALFLVFSFAIVLVILSKLSNAKFIKLGRELNLSSIEMNELIDTTHFGFREIQLSENFTGIADRFDYLKNRSIRAFSSTSLLQMTIKYSYEVILFILVLFIYLINQYGNSGILTTTNISLIVLTIFRLGPAFLRLQASTGSLRNLKGSTLIAREVLARIEDESEELVMSKGTESPKAIEGPQSDRPELVSLRVFKLTFSHNENAQFALKDVSFEVRKGESLAVVGPTGSGKSTLIDLLSGFLNPTSGSIEFYLSDGSVSSAPNNLRIGYVPQSIYLMNDSIRENIMFFSKEKSRGEGLLNKVLETVDLSHFVQSLPLGLDTHVGQIGSKISGGERQRIGIARALMTEPSILFVDEGTNALDINTSTRILGKIKQFHSLDAFISITHSLDNLDRFDWILSLNNGKVDFLGKYEDYKLYLNDKIISREFPGP